MKPSLTDQEINHSEPSSEEMDKLKRSYQLGEFLRVFDKTKILKKNYPNSFKVWNLYAMACGSLNMLQEAQKGFEKAVKLSPNSFDTYNNLGVILQAQNKLDEALQNFKRGAMLNPKSYQIQNNIGTIYQLENNIPEAIKFHTRAVQINPKYIQGLIDLGASYQKSGDLKEALTVYNQALEIEKQSPILFNNIGLILLAQRRLDEALIYFKKAHNLRENFPEALNSIGYILNLQSKFSEAEVYLNKAIRHKIDYVQAYGNLGNSLLNLQRLEDALVIFKKAVNLNKNNSRSYNNLGNALRENQNYQEAIKNYNEALRINPDFAEALNNKGITLKLRGNIEEALVQYKKAIKINPSYPEAYNNLGNLYSMMGRFKEATECYQKAIDLNPSFASGYYNLSKVKKYKRNEPIFDKMLTIYKNANLDSKIYSDICFALAKAYDDIESMHESFNFLVKANTAKRKFIKYDIKSDNIFFDNLKKTAAKISDNAVVNDHIGKNRRPVFILGMPRSGTTLVEQILSSHSQVLGAGELPFVNKYGLRISTGDIYPTTERLIQFRNDYLKGIDSLPGKEKIISDKMPQNFLYLGLIFNTLPEAKVIHVTRQPEAVCWSNFKHNFSENGLGYAYSIKDIVDYYWLYYNLMSFWRQDYGNKIYELNYEDLVINQEHETKKLINHIDLEWQEKCLKPQYNKRFINTNSSNQIRQKLYQGSSQQWQKYKHFLGDALDSLSELR